MTITEAAPNPRTETAPGPQAETDAQHRHNQQMAVLIPAATVGM